MISEEALKSYKKLWIEEFQEEISDEKALEFAINLLTFFKATYKPIKKSWTDDSPEDKKSS